MNIQISNKAAFWYKEELNLINGDYVRFFVRYGGCSTVQSGFSLGISTEEPLEIGIQTVQDGITFYIEEKDLWYFDEHSLIVKYNPELNEPAFYYQNDID